MKKSKFFIISKKNNILRKLYFYYNIYIRNNKFLKNSSQFGEDKFIINKFENNYKGKYLDLGCFHPTRHSNTNLLYKNGWSGINIDLNPFTIELFNFMRPNDININVGISNDTNEKNLYFINEFNTQNTLDQSQLSFLINQHNVNKNEIIKKKIKTQKLDKILKENYFTKIDFFNIDIEGHELEVIKTIDFNQIKFRFICIEMINFNKASKDKSKKIEDILFKNNFNIIKKFGFNYIFENKKFDYTWNCQ
jgi:FkbM family methyltransferase